MVACTVKRTASSSCTITQSKVPALMLQNPQLDCFRLSERFYPGPQCLLQQLLFIKPIPIPPPTSRDGIKVCWLLPVGPQEGIPTANIPPHAEPDPSTCFSFITSSHRQVYNALMTWEKKKKVLLPTSLLLYLTAYDILALILPFSALSFTSSDFGPLLSISGLLCFCPSTSSLEPLVLLNRELLYHYHHLTLQFSCK